MQSTQRIIEQFEKLKNAAEQLLFLRQIIDDLKSYRKMIEHMEYD